MKKTIFSIIMSLAVTGAFNAQNTPETGKGFKFNNNFDLALSTSGNQFAGALSWVHFHALTQKKRFKIGYGVRFTSQAGSKLYYTTAPAILTSKQEGPQVMFAETFPENIDTFYVSHAQNNILNVTINLQYTIKDKYDIGFNIDAAGFTFGPGIKGKYISHQSPLSNSVHSASPTSPNLLLVSDNDIGSLNSELYFRYWFKPKMAVKAGFGFLFTEYTSANKLRLDNDRWRNKVLMGMIGFSINPF